MAIVEQFKGTDNLSQHSDLYMDFTEVQNGFRCLSEYCTAPLDEMAYNIRIITRDVFKKFSL